MMGRMAEMMKNMNIILAFLLSMMMFGIGCAKSADRENVQLLKEAFSLQQHSEGGWFAELYTSPFTQNERATAGSHSAQVVNNFSALNETKTPASL